MKDLKPTCAIISACRCNANGNIMNDALRKEIIFRLVRDWDFKEKDSYLIQGCCPACRKNELFTSVDTPWRLQCNRLNKCGQNFAIQELYPDLFASWSDRYHSTPDNPNAAADAYLQNMRGFDVVPLKGCYRQESFHCPKTGQGSATVRFDITDGVWWERIIDHPERFDRKANFHGEYGGLWWSPARNLAEVRTIWITEGIFDAIALMQHGITAVSVLSCNNYPHLALTKLRESGSMPELVIAFDNDKAGKKSTLKFIERAKFEGWKVTAALPGEGRKKKDWNDLHLLNKLSGEDLKNYFYFGELFIAPTPTDKAALMYLRQHKSEFWFEHGKKTWWGNINLEKAEKIADALGADINDKDVIRQAMTVTQICNCYPTALYYQINELTREVMYFFQIEKPFEDTTYIDFNNYQLGSAADFKKHLLSDKGALFKGTSKQLDAIIEEQLPDIRTVNTVDFIGYSKEYQAYIFNSLAVKNGKIYTVNKECFFEIGKLNIKSTAKSLKLNFDANKKMNESWSHLLWQAFGEKGMVTLAFWLGSAFAEQIRGLYKSFPFLEINGEPGTGKSTLLETLWKLFGRDYEGFDPQKATHAGRARTFSQVANLPVVLIEGDRMDEGAKQRKFSFDELKSFYDGNPAYTRGVRNGGNETTEPPFRGTICIAQNAAVNASEAILQRIVQICTDRKNHNQQSRDAAQQLLRLEVTELSGFLLQSISKEKEVMELIKEKVPEYEAKLEMPEITTYRIVKNHALIMALLDALNLVIPLQQHWIDNTRNEIIKMAIERQYAISVDHPFVIQFWETFDYLTSMGIPLNHSKDKNVIAINLNHFSQMASEYRQPLPHTSELKEILKVSKSRKFLGAKQVRSIINEIYNRDRLITVKRSETLHCWLFSAG